jgi:hypothetical protein
MWDSVEEKGCKETYLKLVLYLLVVTYGMLVQRAKFE